MYSKMRKPSITEDIKKNSSSALKPFMRNSRNNNSQAESQNEGRKAVYKVQTPICHPHQDIGLNYSIVSPKSAARDISPSLSIITNQNDQYFHEMERSLLGENMNLKEHNNFLVAQIKVQFEREKKYKRMFLVNKQKIKNLQNINLHLQSQLQMLTSNIVAEIQRMQKLLQNDRSRYDEDPQTNQNCDGHKSQQGLGWQTQATINHNLQDLKGKVYHILQENTGKCKDIESKYQHYMEYRTNESRNIQSSRKKEYPSSKMKKTKQSNGEKEDKEDQYNTYLLAKLIADQSPCKQQTNK